MGELAAQTLPIRRHVAPNITAVLANHVVVRSDPNLFQLFFFNAEPPIVIDGDSDDVKMAAAAMTHLDAHCVSRVVIPPYVMPGSIKALQTNFENHQSTVAAMSQAKSAGEKKK